MADKDNVKVGDTIEVVVSKPIQGKIGEAYKTKGWAKPNRMGQRATVSGVQQVSKKTGKVNWTTPEDGKILIKYIDYTHADGFDVPGQTQGKPPVLGEGEWKIVGTSSAATSGVRTHEEDGKFKPDDPSTEDVNEAYVGGFGGVGDSTPSLDSGDASSDASSDDTSIGGFGGIGGFGSIGGDSTKSSVSDTASDGSEAKPSKPKKKTTSAPIFDVSNAGWLPFDHTMKLDMEQIKKDNGGYNMTISGQTGFKIRVLFSPTLNAMGDNLIANNEQFDDMKLDSAKMVMREYVIGDNLTKCEIRGSGTSKLHPISQNYNPESKDNEEYPQSPTVISFNLKWSKQGILKEVMVTLVGATDTMQITHKLQTAKWEGGGSSGTATGWGNISGMSLVGDSSGSAEYSPALNKDNYFYDKENTLSVIERYAMELDYDSDNSFFKEEWLPMVVDWDKAPILPIKMDGSKNIGGYIKISMKCDKVEDVTDRIPGVWMNYTKETNKRDWNKTPRRVTLIMPKADDSNMFWIDDKGNKMSTIDEIRSHTVNGKIHSVRLTATIQRAIKDEDGNAVLDDNYKAETETVIQHKIIEKGRTQLFEVKNRIGKQGYAPLEGEIESIKVYPKGDCEEEWAKWKGQRESFLTYGEQTLTWLKHSENDEESLYIIVANDKNPNTGQLIVLTKKTLAEAEEELDEEVAKND